jgi:hypothetical protein
MGEKQIMTHNLPMAKNLYDVLTTYIHETEFDEVSYSGIDEFIISAIVEKFNNENEIFDGKIDENGFTDNRSITEHYCGINRLKE